MRAALARALLRAVLVWVTLVWLLLAASIGHDINHRVPTVTYHQWGAR